jgi:hypothetical protein
VTEKPAELQDWRERFPRLFELCTPATPEQDPWERALAKAEGRDRELLALLQDRLAEAGARLELGPAGPRLEAEPKWIAAHFTQWLDLQALVYDQAKEAIRKYFYGGDEKN